MEHSSHYTEIKFWYDNGNWTKAWVHDAVTHPTSSPYLTKDEYKEITGEIYVE